jgi:hypothetical protein
VFVFISQQKQKPIDLQSNFYHFLRWHGADEVLDRLGLDREELEDKYAYDIEDVIEKIENSMTQ